MAIRSGRQTDTRPTVKKSKKRRFPSFSSASINPSAFLFGSRGTKKLPSLPTFLQVTTSMINKTKWADQCAAPTGDDSQQQQENDDTQEQRQEQQHQACPMDSDSDSGKDGNDSTNAADCSGTSFASVECRQPQHEEQQLHSKPQPREALDFATSTRDESQSAAPAKQARASPDFSQQVTTQFLDSFRSLQHVPFSSTFDVTESSILRVRDLRGRGDGDKYKNIGVPLPNRRRCKSSEGAFSSGLEPEQIYDDPATTVTACAGRQDSFLRHALRSSHDNNSAAGSSSSSSATLMAVTTNESWFTPRQQHSFDFSVSKVASEPRRRKGKVSVETAPTTTTPPMPSSRSSSKHRRQRSYSRVNQVPGGGSRWIIPIEHPFKIVWDVITVILSIVNAYLTHASIRDRQFGLYRSPFIAFCDAWFLVDILLNFVTERRTANGDAILRDHRSICARYLTSWFAIDAFSLFPWEFMYVQPIIDLQNRRSFWKKLPFRSKAVLHVTRKLRSKHFRWFGTVTRHTKQHGVGAKRLLRLIIKYAPKYVMFLRNMKGVVAMRLLRFVHWIRRLLLKNGDAGGAVTKSDASTRSVSTREFEDDMLLMDDEDSPSPPTQRISLGGRNGSHEAVEVVYCKGWEAGCEVAYDDDDDDEEDNDDYDDGVPF